MRGPLLEGPIASHALRIISRPHLTNGEDVLFKSSNKATQRELRNALKAFNYCLLGLRRQQLLARYR